MRALLAACRSTFARRRAGPQREAVGALYYLIPVPTERLLSITFSSKYTRHTHASSQNPSFRSESAACVPQPRATRPGMRCQPCQRARDRVTRYEQSRAALRLCIRGTGSGAFLEAAARPRRRRDGARRQPRAVTHSSAHTQRHSASTWCCECRRGIGKVVAVMKDMVAADQNQSAATAPIGHSLNTTPPALCTQCAVALSVEDGSIEVNRWNHRPSEARFHTTCSDPLLTRASVRGRLESSITASVALVAPMRRSLQTARSWPRALC